MQTRLFEAFAQMIEAIPAQAIPRAMELERRMLEDDLFQKRVASLEETASSVLSFCQFIHANLQEETIPPVQLPVAHIAFYRKTLMRLIEIGTLPFTAKEQFDATFSSSFIQSLVC
jgi:hypothetical protein